MDVEVAKKFGLVEITCFEKGDITIIIKDPYGSTKIFLPDKPSKTKDTYDSYKGPYVYSSVYGPYSSYSSYSGGGAGNKIIKKGNACFINFEPEVHGVHEIEVIGASEKKLLRLDL